MLAVNGYYDGNGYVTEENVVVKPYQRVIITYLDDFEKPKRTLKKYVGKISREDSDFIFQTVEDGRKVDANEW